MVTERVDYKAELEKLPPDERETYVGSWRDYLAKLPRGAYVGQMTKLSQQFGPEFASQLIQPGLVTEKPEPPPIGELPAAQFEPEIPWYAKPIAWAAETPIGKPIFEGLEKYRKGWLTPAAMTLAQTYAPKVREELGGVSPFKLSVEERERIWEESELPWLQKIIPELAVDPMMYFGWGLAPKAVQMAEKAGMKGLAQVIKPIASLEEAYIKAAAKPVKLVGKALRRIPEIKIGEIAGKPRTIGALFQESPRSMVNNEPLHVYDLLRNLDEAGKATGRPLSQILQDIRMGVVDPTIASTITNPKQKAVLTRLIANRDKLDLDVIARVIDGFPERASVVLARKETALLAKELGRTVPAKQLGAIALSKDVYGIWKRTVLTTPWYVEQNIVENFIRPVMVGVNPLRDINAIVASPVFNRWPIDMQRRALTFAQRWNQQIPENLKWARSVSTGGLTESMSGALATGKSWPTLTAGATLDEQAMLRTFESMYNGFERELMGKTSAKTAQALAEMDALWDDAIRANSPIRISEAMMPDDALMAEATELVRRAEMVAPTDPNVIKYKELFEQVQASIVPKERRALLDAMDKLELKVKSKISVVEPELLEHLKQISVSGSADDVLATFAEVQRNKTMAIARAITQQEKGLPDMIRSSIQKELPRLWARNDITGIERLFKKHELSLPQQVQTYQKQALLQRLSYYKKLVRQEVPRGYQPLYNQILNRFKYERVADREARLTAAKSLSEFESAMFSANLESMREMESLILGNVITDSIATKQYAKIATYLGIHDQLVQAAFKAGDDLTEKTFKLSDVVRFAKDPKKTQQRWDEYIMGIQSEFPDQAALLQAATPNNDLLWSTRRAVQDRRWFKVSQDELASMQMDPNRFPKMVDANGKLLTMEDFMTKQKVALKSWQDRAVNAFARRHEVPTSKNKLLDNLRDETVRIKEGVALQELKLQNEAMDLAQEVAYDTFGNYGVRTNLDDIMQGIGMPFWFFPSRSIPFYARQLMQKPKLGIEVMTMQQQAEESNYPTRLHGFVPIPGTDYFYNPLAASMLWQLAGQYDWTPAHLGGLEQGQLQMQQKLGMSFGPQWMIATALVSRLMVKQGGAPLVVGEPKYVIPQHRWLEAVENLDLPGLSQIAGVVSEPFDAYLRAVFGSEVAEWQKREVEKYIVDMGENPQDASKEVIQDAWKKYWTRQLLSIPGGVVKELTLTEKARFDMMGAKAKELGLTKKETAELRAAGESPWAGLRQDQLETLFADIPAQKLNRYIRPIGLTSQSRPIWEDYIQLKVERETLRGDPENPVEGSRIHKELALDAALRAGRISPREWKSLYRQNYADYVSQMQALERAYPQAPKTEGDWEAYRDLLGWDEPVRHPDDIKLDEYYEVMESSKFENDLGEFDYDAYRRAETTFFQGLTPETISYIKSRKDRYKTPFRAAYTRDMEKAQPYYDLQDAVLAQYPPEIAMVIQYALASPDSAIQRAILINHPDAMIALRRIRVAKAQFRAKNTELDRILRFWSS